jgi:LAO/AO transport system ATPase
VLDSLIERFHKGDRLALSRLLTLTSQGHDLNEILRRIGPAKTAARVVAITGGAGVGKSTLIGKLIEASRERGLSVAVLACDPQSPLSGGALLGDRFRMFSRPEDDGIFIRSVAAPGGQGGVASHIAAMTSLLEAFGFNFVLLETVGAGQGDTVVRSLADVVVVLLQAETGDDLQWEKAGLLEIADVLVIHKGDLAGSERVEAQVRAALQLSTGPTAPVVRVSSKTGEGIDQLWQLIMACPGRRGMESNDGRELLRLVQEDLADRFLMAEAAQDPTFQEIIRRWQERRIESDEAASTLLELLGTKGTKYETNASGSSSASKGVG